MANDLEAQIKAYQQELIEPAALLFSVQRSQGVEVRRQSMSAYGRLLDAHLLLTGVLGAALLRVNGKITQTTPIYELCDPLYASFVIGLESSEGAIAEGRYLQAHALLRQEMETVAQLVAIRQGRRQEGKQPNVALLEKSLARLYGELSASAHVAKHHIMRAATECDTSGTEATGPTSGIRYFPAFDSGLARRSFGLHLMLILRIIEQMSIDHSERYTDEDGFSERDTEAVNLAISLMRAEGIVEFDD